MTGVLLKDGTKISAKSVIITTGTFLRGQINIGLDIRPAGRIGDEPAIGLAKSLEALEFRMGRLKTGTPPRIKKDTIDFSNLSVQLGDSPPVPFSFLNDRVWIDSKHQVIEFVYIISVTFLFVFVHMCSDIHISKSSSQASLSFDTHTAVYK